jgi:hypothetical protein
LRTARAAGVSPDYIGRKNTYYTFFLLGIERKSMLQSTSDWLHALPLGWMAAVVFGLTFLTAAAIYTGLRTLEPISKLRVIADGL